MRPAAILLLLTSAAACGPAKVVVTIENRGTEPLYSAAIWTGTYTRALGNVISGQTVTDTLLAEGETSISLQHGTSPRKTLVLVGYFQAGDIDSIRAQVKTDSVLKVQRW